MLLEMLFFVAPSAQKHVEFYFPLLDLTPLCLCTLGCCFFMRLLCCGSWVSAHRVQTQRYFTLIASSLLFFHSNLRSRTRGRRRVSDCFGVCVSVQPVECCVHDRLFFLHSVGRGEWAAIEMRTLVPFTTVEVKHRVRAKCRWALLPWKGPLSRVSFQVSAERDTTESHSRLVFVCLPVFLCVSLKSSFYLYSPISQQKLSYDAFDVE